MLKFPWIAIYATNAKSIQSSITFSCTSRQIYRLDSKKRRSVEGIRVSNLIDGDLSVMDGDLTTPWRFSQGISNSSHGRVETNCWGG